MEAQRNKSALQRRNSMENCVVDFLGLMTNSLSVNTLALVHSLQSEMGAF
jgi:hypothetical protein